MSELVAHPRAIAVLARLGAFNRHVATLAILVCAVFLSAFINDTPVVAETSAFLKEYERSLATPMGCQTNVLIMQPGGYVFRDFVRVGGPLVVLMIVTSSFALSRACPT
jgi:hypothetical protein